MTTYRLILVIKLLAVLAYAGGLTAALCSPTPAARRRAVHAVASPALLAIWAAGYLLTVRLHVPLTELWIVAALLLSLTSQLALIRQIQRPSIVTAIAAIAPLAAVIVLMVFRPTWAVL
jgi:hypothetical protein